MISTFVSHESNGTNSRIWRNSVLGEMCLPLADAALQRLDDGARKTARALRGARRLDDRPIHAERPIPALDFNAVGLLYFPTFSRIAETAAHAQAPVLPALEARDIVYLGNIHPGEAVQVHAGTPDWIMTRQDGSPIAAIRTRRVAPA